MKEAEEVATINEVVVRLLLPLPHGRGPDFGAAGGARRWRLARAEWAGKRAEGAAVWAREVNADGGAGAGAGGGGELMAGGLFFTVAGLARPPRQAGDVPWAVAVAAAAEAGARRRSTEVA